MGSLLLYNWRAFSNFLTLLAYHGLFAVGISVIMHIQYIFVFFFFSPVVISVLYMWVYIISEFILFRLPSYYANTFIFDAFLLCFISYHLCYYASTFISMSISLQFLQLLFQFYSHLLILLCQHIFPFSLLFLMQLLCKHVYFFFDVIFFPSQVIMHVRIFLLWIYFFPSLTFNTSIFIYISVLLFSLSQVIMLACLFLFWLCIFPVPQLFYHLLCTFDFWIFSIFSFSFTLSYVIMQARSIMNLSFSRSSVIITLIMHIYLYFNVNIVILILPFLSYYACTFISILMLPFPFLRVVQAA